MDNDKLKSLSKSAFDENGKLRSFSEQVDTFIKEQISQKTITDKDKQMKSGDMFILAENSNDLKIPMSSGHPLVMSQSNFRKSSVKHNINLKDLFDLPEMIKNSPIAVESYFPKKNSKGNLYKKSVVCVLDKEYKGNNLIAAIHFSEKKRETLITVNEVNSVHPKDIQNLLDRTEKMNRKIFTNEKTKEWLASKGILTSKRANHSQSNSNNPQPQSQAKNEKNSENITKNNKPPAKKEKPKQTRDTK